MNVKYRTLLSEVLPFETPLFFDNYGFYNKLVSGDIDENFIEDTFKLKKVSFSIPFNYDVKRNGGNGVRRLSVIHPVQQLEIVDFYERYDLLLVKNSIGSPFSLRHINDVAKLYYNTSHELIVDYDKTRVEMEDDDKDTQVYVSYFSYKEIDRMYKFFKDMPMFRLEQKYEKLHKLDVAKCFYHIYTHSIAWALEGKAFAKAHLKEERLSSKFDKLMQHCNYNETNGIVVGPEVSRIFAEIIFRRIDFRVLERLKGDDVVFGRDYELRRYVDDMMIFANDDAILDKIEKTIKEELEKYKLYVNKSKTATYTRPFGTPLSCGKQHLLEEYQRLEDIISKSKKPPYKESLAFLRKFRTLASEHSLAYGDLNRMTLSLIARMVKNEGFGGVDSTTKLRCWLIVLDIAFYVFSLDMSATASLRLCRIILQTSKAFKSEEREAFTEIREKLIIEVHRMLGIHFNTSRSDLTPIEVINPLLALKSMGIDVCDKELLIKLFHLETEDALDCSRLNYFNICSLLMLIQNDTKYSDIKSGILISIKEKFGNNYWKMESEMVLLLLDLMTCPYIDKKEKQNILVVSKLASDSTRAGEKRIKLQGEITRWFFDWQMSTTALDYYLKKKEYRPTYE